MEDIVTLDEHNIKQEHICCAISDKKCREGYEAKKEWIRSQLAEGFVFKKLDVRGKVFIEYIPAENAWSPVEAPGYMMINCFWVSGQFKGKGNAKRLLQECLDDAKAVYMMKVIMEKLHRELDLTLHDIIWGGGDIDPRPLEREIRERFSRMPDK